MARIAAASFAAIALLASLAALMPTGRATTCQVPSAEHPTIQSALDEGSCDPIVVFPGTYLESLTIARSVTLSGIGGAAVTILEVPSGETGIRIAWGGVVVRGLAVEGGARGVYVAPDPPTHSAISGITLDVMEIRTATGAGLGVENAAVSIDETSVHDNGGPGIELAPALGFALSRSTVRGNDGDGLESTNSIDVSVAGSAFEDNGGAGLRFVGGEEDPGLPVRSGEPTVGILLQSVRVDGNAFGILFEGREPGAVTSVAVGDAEVVGNSDGTFDLTATEALQGVGLAFVNGTSLAVAGSAFGANGDAGVAAADAASLAFAANSLESHEVAFRFVRVDSSLVAENFVSGDAGIVLSGGIGNTFEDNIMTLTSEGIRLDAGSVTVANNVRGNVIEAAAPGGVAIGLLGTELNAVNENVILGPWSVGLSLVDVSVGDFGGNVIGGTWTGVLVDGGNALVLEGNVIAGGAVYGVRVHEADAVEIVGNVIASSAVGVGTTGEVIGLLVSGNVLTDNAVGVRVEGPSRTASVRHNVVDSNVLGVDIANTWEVTVSYNIISENTDAGIQVRSSDDVLVSRNEVVVGGLAGIRILDSGSSLASLRVEGNNVSAEVPQPSRDPGGGCPGPLYRMYGIEARRSNLVLQDNLVRDILHASPDEGCDSGYGMYVEAPEDAQILRNVVQRYQKYGILVVGAPAAPVVDGVQNVWISENEVRGLGPLEALAQGGILVRDGAHAAVEDNVVGLNWHTGTGDVAFGIGVFDAPRPVDVLGNRASDNQFGIYLRGFPDSLVAGSTLVGNVQGIRIESAGGTTVHENEAESVGGCPTNVPPASGIFVLASPGVQVTNNSVEMHCTGIWGIDSDDLLVRWNDVLFSEVAGVHVSGGSMTLVEDNHVAGGVDGIVVDAGAVSAYVTTNLVEMNERGIVVDGTFFMTVASNLVRDGLLTGIALSDDLLSFVHENEVFNHGTGLAATGSVGIVIDKNEFDDNEDQGVRLDAVSYAAVVHRNTIRRSEVGVWISGVSNELSVAHNLVEWNVVGVKVDTAASTLLVEYNQIRRNEYRGIHVTGSASGNSISRNVIMFNGDGTPDAGGIVVYGDSNVVSRNTVNNNDGVGILLKLGAEGNLIERNVVNQNTPKDCVDENPRGRNTWRQNTCNVLYGSIGLVPPRWFPWWSPPGRTFFWGIPPWPLWRMAW